MGLFDLIDSVSVAVEDTTRYHSVDRQAKLAFVADRSNRALHCVDLETAAVRDTLDLSLTDKQPESVEPDPTRELAVVTADNSADSTLPFIGVVDYSDPDNLSVQWTRADEAGVGGQIFNAVYRNLNTDDGIAYVPYSDSNSDVGINVVDYTTGTADVVATPLVVDTSFAGTGTYDPENDIIWDEYLDDVESTRRFRVWEVSADGRSLTVAGTTPVPDIEVHRDLVPDGPRALALMLLSDGNLHIYSWDGASISPESSIDCGIESPLTIAYLDAHDKAYVAGIQGGGTADLAEFDVSDPANPALLNERDGYANDATAIGSMVSGRLFEGGEAWALFDGTEDLVTTVETSIVAPDKPTCVVEEAGEQAVSLSSSAYSHPDGVAHKDSKWQVRLATDSDWTSPEYDSGFVAEDLEEHTASPLDIDEEYEARVIHRDENDLEAASDPVAFSTTGESKQGEGPEGLFFGEGNGNRLFRFGRVFEDAGSAITAVLESNHIAPAGAQGEAVFRSIHLTIEVGTELDLTFTPIVDGTEVTNAEVTHTVEETSRVRRTLEVALMQDVTDSTGTPVAKVGLRGSWFGVKIEAVDQAGFSPRVSLESLEVEVELVRESAGSVNESA